MPKEKCNLTKINNENISLMLTLNRFYTLFLSAVDTGKCMLWMVTFTICRLRCCLYLSAFVAEAAIESYKHMGYW